MSKGFSRRILLGGLLASAAGRGLANAPLISVRPAPRAGGYREAAIKSAKALIAEAKLGGKVSFAVADARTGLVLEAANSGLPQPPASVTKSITALYALEALGPGYRFRTRLVATGPIQGGRLKGDLILVGGGDPVLNTDHLGGLARALKAAGVHEVTGKFRVHDRALPYVRAIDTGQPDHLGYNPAVAGLNLNFNRVHFEWARSQGGYDIVMDAPAERYRPRVAIARMKVVNRALPVYTYRDGNGADNWTVASKVLGKAGSRWLPVRKPALYAAEVFQTLARSQGIKLPRAIKAASAAGGTVIAEHKSPELRVILRGMLKYSNNLTAEAVGLTASIARGGKVNSLSASAARMTRWLEARAGIKASNFVDHSGLGAASRVTASDMVRALVKDGPDGSLHAIMKEIPLRDADGKPLKTHPIKVRAKTGTLNFVSALAGFVTAPDGTRLAFAIFAADQKRRATVKKSDREAPQGRKSWNRSAKRLQQRLIERWAALYGV